MPARDIYHDTVKTALIKDGWTITHDPYPLKVGLKDMFIDLGAEQFIAAVKENVKIAVEIKSFVGPSEVEDLKNALGQFILYHDFLHRSEPDRILYLAIRHSTFIEIFEEPIGRILLENQRFRLLIFDSHTEVIIKWIP